jgi:hypothetical protein
MRWGAASSRSVGRRGDEGSAGGETIVLRTLPGALKPAPHFRPREDERNVLRHPDRVSAFLGTEGWRTKVAGPRDVPKLRDVLREQLLPFGYQKAEILHEPLLKNTKNAPLYHLVLIAKHGLADKIWQSVIRTEGSGQKRLW